MSATLLSYITLHISSQASTLSQSSVAKYERLAQCMQQYLDGCDVDLRKAQTHRFVSDFADFLSRQCGYSVGTVTEILGDLRTIVRSAIKRGLLANLDVIPSCIAALTGKPEVEADDYRVDTNVTDAINRLFATIDRWAVERLADSQVANPTLRRRIHEKATNYRCLCLYLFGISCYGLEIVDIVGLRHSDLSPEGVYIAKYGCTLPLSPAALRLIDIYNFDTRRPNGIPSGEYLFNTLTAARDNKSADQLAPLITRRIKRVLKQLMPNIPLLRTDAIYTDWLTTRIEAGISPTDAERLIDYAIDNFAPNADMHRPLLQTDKTIIGRQMTDNWYLLRLLPGTKSTRPLVDQIIASQFIGATDIARRRIYDPIDRLASDHDRKHSPLTRFIFIKTSLTAALSIDLMLRDKARLLRNTATRTPAIIAEDELRQMQTVIRDFRDDLELIDKADWLRHNAANLHIGGRARILTGPLKGLEATILDIYGANGRVSTSYLLEYAAGAITFKTKLHNVELEPLPLDA